MKIDMKASELLALYNVLYSQFDSPLCIDPVCSKDDEDNLRQVYERVKKHIIQQLSDKYGDVSVYEAWLQKEQEKINNLNVQENKDTL